MNNNKKWPLSYFKFRHKLDKAYRIQRKTYGLPYNDNIFVCVYLLFFCFFMLVQTTKRQMNVKTIKAQLSYHNAYKMTVKLGTELSEISINW